MLQIPTYNLFSLLTRRYHNFRVCSFYFSGTQNFVDFHQAVNWLASQRSIKPIGPMIPSFYLDKQLEDDKEYGLSLFNPNPDGCHEWLDSKETGSVVYVSLEAWLHLERSKWQKLLGA